MLFEVRFVLKCCGACMHGRGHVCRAAASSEACFVHRGAEGSKIRQMAGYRARTAEPSAWPRALRSHPHRKHQTCEEGARARRERARAGRRGAGPRRWSLAAPTYRARCCWMRGRYITYFSLNRKQYQEMANRAGIPNLVSEVSCALCSAGNSMPRSSEYTSFQP